MIDEELTEACKNYYPTTLEYPFNFRYIGHIPSSFLPYLVDGKKTLKNYCINKCALTNERSKALGEDSILKSEGTIVKVDQIDASGKKIEKYLSTLRNLHRWF